MDSLKIETGEIRLSVNGDENRVIAFNPTDILFAEKFYQTIGEFEIKLSEFQRRSQDIEAEQEEDANGLPVNVAARIALLRETCEYIREKIDNLFGKGASQTAFGDSLSLDVFSQFFDGISPYFRHARTEKIAKYINPNVRSGDSRTRRKRKKV